MLTRFIDSILVLETYLAVVPVDGQLNNDIVLEILTHSKGGMMIFVACVKVPGTWYF